MPIANEQRDKQFKRDIEKGLSITELATKYRISKRQVSRLKKKLREKEATRQPVTKETATRPPVAPGTEKMAFWLDRDMKEKLKIEAIKKKRTASDIVRELLRNYFRNK